MTANDATSIRLDLYEVLRLLEWSSSAKAGLVLAVCSAGSLIWLLVRLGKERRAQRKNWSWPATAMVCCAVGGCLLAGQLKEQYLITLLSSENDRDAGAACYHIADHLTAREIQHWLADDRLTANARYYLAVACILAGTPEAHAVLRGATQFQNPHFFQSNGLNDVDGIVWPAQGTELGRALSSRVGKRDKGLIH